MSAKLERAIESAKREMDNAKSTKEYWQAVNLYMFLLEQKESAI